MREPNQREKKQYARLQELTAIARQRYLDTVGDGSCYPSGIKGDDYMSDEERQESIELTRQIFGVRIIGTTNSSSQTSTDRTTKTPDRAIIF